MNVKIFAMNPNLSRNRSTASAPTLLGVPENPLPDSLPLKPSSLYLRTTNQGRELYFKATCIPQL